MIRLFQHLLPNARAWRLTIDKNLRRFFAGLSVLPADIQQFVDAVWQDVFPATTRQLSLWEDQFGLPAAVLTDAERRARITAAWLATGGQSPRYIQDVLQAAGFAVYVHEWWEPGTNPPVARNPNDVITQGAANTPFLMSDGGGDAQDGDAVAQDGATLSLTGYLLVNKIPGVSYAVPTNPQHYPYIFYVGGETFPDVANVPESRRDEFENLLLKISPTEQWIGVLVGYV